MNTTGKAYGLPPLPKGLAVAYSLRLSSGITPVRSRITLASVARTKPRQRDKKSSTPANHEFGGPNELGETDCWCDGIPL